MTILTGTITSTEPLMVRFDGQGELTLKKPLGFVGNIGSRVYVLKDGNKYILLSVY